MRLVLPLTAALSRNAGQGSHDAAAEGRIHHRRLGQATGCPCPVTVEHRRKPPG
jgi:hypothetical protein